MWQRVVDGPAYRRVADELRAEILSGKLLDGARLPSLANLAARFGVTDDIAHQAIRQLRTEGLVESRQGAPSRVRRFAPIVRSSPGRLSREQWGSGKAIQDHDTGPRPRTVDVVLSEVPAPDYVAAGLDLEPGATVLSRTRRFLVDERPVQLATSYYPLELTRGTAIAYTDTGPGGTYARLAELGHAPERFTERISARAPHPDELAALTPAADRIYQITRYAYTGTGRCVEVNRMIIDATVYELEYHFSA